jgi:hypothetical protein
MCKLTRYVIKYLDFTQFKAIGIRGSYAPLQRDYG